MMAAGGFMMFGACGFFAYAFWAVAREDYERTGGSQRMAYTAAAYTSPDEK